VGPVFEMGLDICLHVGLMSELVLGIRPRVAPVFEMV
jgi:hypothetical protein